MPSGGAPRRTLGAWRGHLGSRLHAEDAAASRRARLMDLMQQTDTQDGYIEQIDVAQTIAFDPRTAEYYVGLEDPGQSRK